MEAVSVRVHQQRLARLADAYRASLKVAQDDLATRDAEIADAAGDGMSVREISQAVLMSTTRVQAIILAQAARRQAQAQAATGR